jgi:hypothetical protein
MILLFIIIALNTLLDPWPFMPINETCLILGKFCMVLESLLRRPSIVVNPEILYQRLLIFFCYLLQSVSLSKNRDGY